MKQEVTNQPRLGVNIDHVATLRQLRNTHYPNLVQAAQACITGGANQITVHLREDRRHIQDEDVFLLRNQISVDLNLELAATDEMLKTALKLKPHAVCLVPEKREERTTEGGLDFSNQARNLFMQNFATQAAKAGILVSFFIEPDPHSIETSHKLMAAAVEFHTGALCLAYQKKDYAKFESEMLRLKEALKLAQSYKLITNLGHGIDYEIAPKLSKLDGIHEYNIGHAIICEAVFRGLTEATKKMKDALFQK